MKRVILSGAIVFWGVASPSAWACDQDVEYSRMFPAVAEFGRDPFEPTNKDEIGERIRHICHYLSEHPQVSLKVNGYTDPRGSATRNLARGQRYATWAMKRLIMQGCDARRIALHSYGEAGEPQVKSAPAHLRSHPTAPRSSLMSPDRRHPMHREHRLGCRLAVENAGSGNRIATTLTEKGNTMNKRITLVAAMAALMTAPAYAEPKAGEVWKEPNTGIEFVYIPAGCFDMGDEGASRRVCIDKPFMLSKYEITQEQYRTVMSSKPSQFQGDSNPVEQVSWNDTQAFAREMNNATGQRYRLPTEAEWEYACRAGGQHSQYCGQGFVDKLAWTSGNSDSKTHPVGQKAANAWGLYDMSGNVWEWVEDRYDNEHDWRVLRGGSWNFVPQNARAAYRSSYAPAKRYFNNGFRLARTLP